MEDDAVTASMVTDVTAEYFGIETGELLGRTRAHQVVKARWIAMYLCRELTNERVPAISRHFGRTYTEVVHYPRKVESEMLEDAEVLKQISEITGIIEARITSSRGSRS